MVGGRGVQSGLISELYHDIQDIVFSDRGEMGKCGFRRYYAHLSILDLSLTETSIVSVKKMWVCK